MGTKDLLNIKDGNDGFSLLYRYRSAVMGFAALWVFVFHEWLPVFGSYPKAAMLENFIQRIGFCGVDIFLFLSGIGMVYSISRSDKLLLFYYKRIKRILFPFLLVAIIRWQLENWSVAELLKNISGMNFYRVNIYSFLWFVPMIMTFYILFPLYYWLFIRSSSKGLFTCGALMIWLIWTLRVRMVLRSDLFGFTNRIPIFLIGILFGYAAQHKKVIFDKLVWGFLGLVLLLGLYLSYLSNYAGLYILVPESNCCVPNILMAISVSFLLAGLLYLLNERLPVKAIGMAIWYVLSFYGLFTFEFYCIQEWLGGLLMQRMRDRYSPAAVNIILLVSVTAAAAGIKWISQYFWILAERIFGEVKALPHLSGKESMKEKDIL